MNCEEVDDPCLVFEPCQNEATCETISSSEYSCLCPAGYTGGTCAEIGDACLVLEPCVSGNCTSGDGSEYSCDCFTGFTGADCDINIDDCVDHTNCSLFWATNLGQVARAVAKYGCFFAPRMVHSIRSVDSFRLFLSVHSFQLSWSSLDLADE